jgi:hypothetical protein
LTKVEKIIRQAVKEGIEAGMQLAEKQARALYKATERRLYALPDLREKVERDKAYLRELQTHGAARRSKDIIRFKKHGVRLSDEDIKEAMVQDLLARIAADEFEIKTIEEAMEPVKGDEFFLSVSGRYFGNWSDEKIGTEIHCDARTVRRHRGRLVRRIAVRLYGAAAV